MSDSGEGQKLSRRHVLAAMAALAVPDQVRAALPPHDILDPLNPLRGDTSRFSDSQELEAQRVVHFIDWLKGTPLMAQLVEIEEKLGGDTLLSELITALNAFLRHIIQENKSALVWLADSAAVQSWLEKELIPKLSQQNQHMSAEDQKRILTKVQEYFALISYAALQYLNAHGQPPRQ